MIEWKRIEGFDNYEISNNGQVKSIGRTVNRGGVPCFLKETIKKPKKERDGYMTVGLFFAPKKSKTKKIHRLMAEAFISNPENKPQVNHINGIKDDNRLENLEWCTASENQLHALANNLASPKKGVEHYCAKFSENDIISIRDMYDSGDFTCLQIASIYNVSRRTIGFIVNRKSWKHI